MTFRTSDILLEGSLIIIGLTEVAHLAGCLLGWSFLSITDLLLAEVVIFLLLGAALTGIGRHRTKQTTAERLQKAGRGETKSTRIRTHRCADISDPVADSWNSVRGACMAGRRYDTGDGEYVPCRERGLYGESSYGNGVYTGNTVPV